MHANAITHACPAACCHAVLHRRFLFNHVRPRPAVSLPCPRAPICCPCRPACCTWLMEEASACTARSPLPSLCPRLSLSLFCSLCSRHGLAKLWFELGRRCFHYSASLHARPSAPSPPSCSLPCLHMLAGAASLGAAAAPAQAAAARTRGQSAASWFDIGGAHPRVLFGRRCHAARPHQPCAPQCCHRSCRRRCPSAHCHHQSRATLRMKYAMSVASYPNLVLRQHVREAC
jgi:hypothetical protein